MLTLLQEAADRACKASNAWPAMPPHLLIAAAVLLINLVIRKLLSDRAARERRVGVVRTRPVRHEAWL